MTLLTRLSLLRPLTVYVLMVIAAIGGLTTYLSMPRESFPEIKVPLIVVSTLYPGTSPSDMENQVTRKIETEIKGISGLKELRSQSLDGYSVIEVEFNPDVDLDTALQKVREKVDFAKPELPEDAEDPVIQDVDFSRLPIMIVNLAGDFGMARLKDIADDLKDDIEAIQGVNLVEIVGGQDREVHVFVDARRLAGFRLGLVDIEDAITREHLNIPGGELDIGKLSFLVRVPAEVENPLDVGDFIVADQGGSPVRIRDVARVEYGFEDEETRARVDGRRAISLTVEKRTGANIISVANEVKAVIADYEARLPATADLTIVGDQSLDIAEMLNELQNNILSGLMLVLVVLFLFLGLRPAFIVAAAIPFSMLIGFMVLAFLGYTLNMVVLFSLVLVLGMLVDNAIVTVENIYRHREIGDPPMEAALSGASEVAMPIIASTATTICAFAPLLFWPGITGEFMSFLPSTLIIGLIASLFVALVFNPALALAFFRRPPRTKRRGELGPFTRLYSACLVWALAHRWIVVLGILVIFGVTLAAFTLFNHGVEFFPDIDPRAIHVDLEFPPGTSLETQDDLVRRVEALVADIPDVENRVANVASTGLSNDGSSIGGGGGSNVSRVSLNMLRYRFRTQSSKAGMAEVRKRLDGLSGASITIDKPQEGPPTGKAVSVRLIGEDYAQLGELAEDLLRRLSGVEGLYNVSDDFDTGNPEIRVLVDRDAAARARTNTRELALAVRTALAGAEVAKFRTGEDEFDIVVRFPRRERRALDSLEELTVLDEDGRVVPLQALVDFERAAGPAAIRRVDMKRVITIEADVDYARGVTDAEMRDAAAKVLDQMSLPTGVRWEFAGSNEEEEEAKDFLSRAFLIALMLITLILVTQFDSLVTPLTILASVLLSLIGVFWGLIVTGTAFGIIMTGIGVISLAGIVVNNAIVLCDFIIQEMKSGTPRHEAIVRAGVTRLRPVLLTAITTILGLIPLTIGINFDFSNFTLVTGGESTQWWGPMGVAVIFGLAFATMLTLVVVPVFFDLLVQLSEFTTGVSGRRRRRS